MIMLSAMLSFKIYSLKSTDSPDSWKTQARAKIQLKSILAVYNLKLNDWTDNWEKQAIQILIKTAKQ